MAKTQPRRAVPSGRSGLVLPFQGSSFSKSASITPKAKGGGTTVHDPGAHLTGATAATYATLKAHDTARGTGCAPAYVAYIDAAEQQYEDDMTYASLQSNEGWAPDPRRPNEKLSPRSMAEKAALTKKLAAQAAALKWASDCVQGKVESPLEAAAGVASDASKGAIQGAKAAALKSAASVLTGSGLAQQAAQQAAQRAASSFEIIDGADVIQQQQEDAMQQHQEQQQMMQQQAAMDAALAAEEGEKKKKLILYAVLGLGAAGVVFYFIRRRKA